jgi:hypothetical protein
MLVEVHAPFMAKYKLWKGADNGMLGAYAWYQVCRVQLLDSKVQGAGGWRVLMFYCTEERVRRAGTGDAVYSVDKKRICAVLLHI